MNAKALDALYKLKRLLNGHYQNTKQKSTTETDVYKRHVERGRMYAYSDALNLVNEIIYTLSKEVDNSHGH